MPELSTASSGTPSRAPGIPGHEQAGGDHPHDGQRVQCHGAAQQKRLQDVALELHHTDDDAQHDQGGDEAVRDQGDEDGDAAGEDRPDDGDERAEEDQRGHHDQQPANRSRR